ncbi:efflux transporter outer membrane subunit [Asticcacaulis sp.]|uniref:efflux transporter outer membrane subunit n=1 Tax=Asticcacaulis sp. TaxID=1872648 RepID=UPI0039E396C1
MRHKTPFLLLTSALALSACTMTPKYVRPELPVAQQWPQAVQSATGGSDAQPAGDLPWKQVFLDARLQRVIDTALTNNRDLRVAILNIEKARATYVMTRSSLLPSVSGSVSETRSHEAGADSDVYSATASVSAWELDLFGKIRSESKAAQESFLATAETRRATQISLISETASAWFTLASDQDLLRLARETLQTRESDYTLSKRKFDLGVAAETDLRSLEVETEQARADVAQYEAQVQQDKDALILLTGQAIADADLPDAMPDDSAILANLPAGLPSEVLTRRPDVLSAEHDLKSANGDVGAARAAFFPTISLTGSTGSSSDELSGLFKSGTGTWSFAPSISIPIFSGGYNVANLKSAKAARDVAVATYEKTVQTAFKEVADALATRATIDRRLDALNKASTAADASLTLVQARYDHGIDSALDLTTAQRTAYSAQQSLISIRLSRATNLATLYAALGGGVN